MQIFILIFTFYLIPLVDKDVDDWKLVNEEEGITVFTRLTDDSPIKEVKVNMEIESDLVDFLGVLNDVGNYTNWVYKCIAAEKVETVSGEEFYYYTESDFPFPISNRDMVLHSTQSISADGKSAMSRSVAAADKKPIEDGIVRITEFDSTWTITEISAGNLQIEYLARTDPGGYLPAWVVNLGIGAAQCTR